MPSSSGTAFAQGRIPGQPRHYITGVGDESTVLDKVTAGQFVKLTCSSRYRISLKGESMRKKKSVILMNGFMEPDS